MKNYGFIESFRLLNVVIFGNRYIIGLGIKFVRDSIINGFLMIVGKLIKV